MEQHTKKRMDRPRYLLSLLQGKENTQHFFMMNFSEKYGHYVWLVGREMHKLYGIQNLEAL